MKNRSKRRKSVKSLQLKKKTYMFQGDQVKLVQAIAFGGPMDPRVLAVEVDPKVVKEEEIINIKMFVDWLRYRPKEDYSTDDPEQIYLIAQECEIDFEMKDADLPQQKALAQRRNRVHGKLVKLRATHG